VAADSYEQSELELAPSPFFLIIYNNKIHTYFASLNLFDILEK